ncbi:hypothetical protein E4656_10375 [Natronospirillum operosum]|uniref:OmpA-like domain-containing protein n=1 Tax=Natronospirillum operosum TaxID=2759953 RepID=A0A4Z0WAQ4_9GAMM|nr:OmpA family protein [Natronospirillum operosum]TGG93445.1 hypothetical protein E4656_10375 [Natronospirillum operosum]
MRSLVILCSVLLLQACTSASVSDTDWPGYRTGAEGELLRDHRGRCWRTADWRPDHAVPECDMALAEEPAPVLEPLPDPLPEPLPVAEPEPEPAVESVRKPEPIWSTQGTVVRFAFDDATLGPDAQAALQGWWAAVSAAPQSRLRIEVSGHTDRLGRPEHNQRLARQRAEGVAAWLRGQGAGRSTIEVLAAGDGAPVTGSQTCPETLDRRASIECLAPDRRVEVTATLIQNE